MAERETTNNLQILRTALCDAHKHQLIEPTFKENFAVKRCVNVANTVLENARIEDTVSTRCIMTKMDMSETTSRNYLLILHQLGYLDKTREGKGFIYKYKYLGEEF